ncbi:hypothetical protein [Sphingomonas sp.]|uniref:hypothetical protein n=1 Tax=Sphingomonas sp. TaxID=28214 RepID=UPI001B067F15|nr:hypothetical protein [Sphingomonas sp.]MBO9712923.1 hypothetical protein [Sphingomonas sp.]
MTRQAMGEGEQREAARRRSSRIILASAVAVGVVLIVGTALSKEPGGRVTPAWGIAFTLIYLGMLLLARRVSRRTSDEFDLRNSVRAMAFGAVVIGFLYPPWYFLWRGQLVPEPSHELLYVLLILSITGRFLWRKFRGG